MARRASDQCVRMLEALGLHDVRVYPAKGHWRTSPYADVYRWEYTGYIKCGDPECRRYDCISASGGCWWTMTDCVKAGGLVFVDGRYANGEVLPAVDPVTRQPWKERT